MYVVPNPLETDHLKSKWKRRRIIFSRAGARPKNNGEDTFSHQASNGSIDVAVKRRRGDFIFGMSRVKLAVRLNLRREFRDERRKETELV